MGMRTKKSPLAGLGSFKADAQINADGASDRLAKKMGQIAQQAASFRLTGETLQHRLHVWVDQAHMLCHTLSLLKHLLSCLELTLQAAVCQGYSNQQ